MIPVFVSNEHTWQNLEEVLIFTYFLDTGKSGEIFFLKLSKIDKTIRDSNIVT